ncbi:hypothetical protein [Roseiconus lacunae]|uniref:Restriction endonuclease n=1 Tax=Roseiconus lacunae TaxID=2605694 RepID=A0ABT7PSJ8_9BACT|nr:hypothetical protein [Roseiconus lacunae]MDM4019461.1 hypothetical protein [Roseiconus lacunae]
MPQLHRHARDPKYFDLLRVLDEFARNNGRSIDDDSTHDALISSLSDALRAHRTNPIRLYGFRTEAMFAHVAAALGSCDIIVEEDAGIHYDSNPDSVAPDFRILTLDGEQFFVEVKNFHQKQPMGDFKIKSSYLEKLRAYADKFNLPLKLAVYWSRWGHWALVDSAKLFTSGDHMVLPIAEAFARNEMSTIGDCMVGTIPPLTLRLHADPNQPREIRDDGVAPFTTQRVELLSGEAILNSELDKKIAWYMMLYGKWSEIEKPVSVTDNLIDYVDFSVSPEAPSEEHDWAIIGSLSEMVSNQYLQQTSVDGSVKRLAPVEQPDSLGVLIPPDFHGDDLRLWRLIIQPNFDGLPSTNIPS